MLGANLLQKRFPKPISIPLSIVLYGLPVGAILGGGGVFFSYVGAALIGLLLSSNPAILGVLAGLGFVSGLCIPGGLWQRALTGLLGALVVALPFALVGMAGMGLMACALICVGLSIAAFSGWIGWCRYKAIDNPLVPEQYSALDQLHKEACDNHQQATATLARLMRAEPQNTKLQRLKTLLDSHKEGFVDRYPRDKARMEQAARRQWQSLLKTKASRDPVSGVAIPSEREQYKQSVQRLKTGQTNPRWFFAEDVNLYCSMQEALALWEGWQKAKVRMRRLPEGAEALEAQVAQPLLTQAGPVIIGHLDHELHEDRSDEAKAHAAQYPQLCINVFQQEHARDPNAANVPAFDAQGYGRHILGQKLQQTLGALRQLDRLAHPPKAKAPKLPEGVRPPLAPSGTHQRRLSM